MDWIDTIKVGALYTSTLVYSIFIQFSLETFH